MAKRREESERSIPSNAPAAIPAKAACDIASEKKDILRRTTKFPTNGHSIPIIMDAISALCIKGYVRNSLIVFMTAVNITSHHFSVHTLDDLIRKRLSRLSGAYELPVHAEHIVRETVDYVQIM